MFINLGPVLYYTAGVFTKAITDDVGWPRGTIASAALPANIAITLLYPLVGWAVGAFGGRLVSLVSTIAFGLALAALGHFSRTPVSFAALMFIASIAAFGLTPLPTVQLVSGWFDRRRGMALSISLALGGIGIAVFPPLAAKLIMLFGWRIAYAGLGGVVILVGVFATLLLIKDPPSRGAVDVGRASKNAGDTLKMAVQTKHFWKLAVAFLAISVAVSGGANSLPLILTDSGMTPQRSAFVMSVMGVSMIAGRLMLARLLDRMFAPRLTAVIFLAPVLAFVALLSPLPVTVASFLAGAFLGIGLGAEVDALGYVTSRIFGVDHLGKIFGSLMIAFSLGLGLGPSIFGCFFDATRSYHAALWSGLICATVASLIMASFGTADLQFQPAER
ncbi:MFS transporter [Paraburkholderia sp. LEh10]|uniref:MFS transporter n=1 Tax=Paraburkholderia sp. LEh10 TaxID=2821353 RepID=UPI001AE7807A|nr:MFS transporter [Paraburkholderia sp. LEh10]MBP0590432.1 MFS transporter [Paraburkholderia sp. LEh10]